MNENEQHMHWVSWTFSITYWWTGRPKNEDLFQSKEAVRELSLDEKGV